MVKVGLPDCWKKVNLGDVLSYIGNGLTHKQNKAREGYPVTRIETISDDCINAEKVGHVNGLPNAKIEKYRLCYGDMLVSHINSDPQLGRAVIYEGEPEILLHGMNLLRMQANPKTLDPFFLNFIFRFYRNRGVFIALASRAVGQASINQSRMKSLVIPLPPLPEQRAIAHVLQTIQEAKFARQKEIALERERKAALMDFLFSHGTKNEPRKQTEIGEIPESWEVVRLAELCTKITDGTHRTPTYVDKGVPFLRVVDIQSSKIDWQQVKWIPRNEHEELIKRCKPEKGDVLLSKNGTIGKTKVVDWDQEFSIFVSLCLLKVKHKSLNNVYLAEFLSSKGLPQIRKRGKRMTVTNLHLVEIRELLIPLPSHSEQQEIAEILQAFDTKIVSLAQEASRLDELFHAMLDELMTGKRSAVPLIDAD